jgi:hypothetical protein
VKAFLRGLEIMESGSNANRKRAYFPPTVTKLTSEQTEKLAADRTQCGDQEATDFLEALRRESDAMKISASPRMSCPKAKARR